MNEPILPPPMHPAPDDPPTCDDLPPWARDAHPAPVLGGGDASARARVDASLRAVVGTTAAPVRFTVGSAHAAVASADAVTWWAWAVRGDGELVGTHRQTLSDASAWAWHQVRP